jgi:hypothetical protein
VSTCPKPDAHERRLPVQVPPFRQLGQFGPDAAADRRSASSLDDMNKWHLVGVVLVVSGISYLRRPDMFRRGIWLKTSTAVRAMSPETYVKYIRGLGHLFVALGVASIIYGFFAAQAGR